MTGESTGDNDISQRKANLCLKVSKMVYKTISSHGTGASKTLA